MKKYGHFDDENREYVITDPATPFPWINYLGNEDFFSLISIGIRVAFLFSIISSNFVLGIMFNIAFTSIFFVFIIPQK